MPIEQGYLNSLFGARPPYAMLLKNTSSSLSLSKSAAMSVRTGEGLANAAVAIFWERRENSTGLVMQVTYLGPLVFCNASFLSPHAETLVGPLHEEPVGAVPVSVDDVRPSVAVKVGESHSSAVLVFVRHTWRGRQLVNGCSA